MGCEFRVAATEETVPERAEGRRGAAVIHLRWATHFQWVPDALAQRCDVRSKYASHRVPI